MVKHTQTICLLLPTNILSLFDHFVGLALKGLINEFCNLIELAESILGNYLTRRILTNMGSAQENKIP